MRFRKPNATAEILLDVLEMNHALASFHIAHAQSITMINRYDSYRVRACVLVDNVVSSVVIKQTNKIWYKRSL